MLRLAASRTTTAAVAARARASRPCGSIGGVASSSSYFSTTTPARKDDGDVVSKFDLISSVAEEHGLNNAQATRIVSGLFDSITENLVNGKSVRVTGFGKFEVVNAAPRMASDFKGGKVAIPERKLVKFRVGQTLKKVVGDS